MNNHAGHDPLVVIQRTRHHPPVPAHCTRLPMNEGLVPAQPAFRSHPRAEAVNSFPWPVSDRLGLLWVSNFAVGDTCFFTGCTL